MLDKLEECPKCGAETAAQGFNYDMQYCGCGGFGPFGRDPFSESVTWTPAATLPDADATVLLFDVEANEPVWPGYYDGERWRYADGMPAKPTYYAPMLKGPKV